MQMTFHFYQLIPRWQWKPETYGWNLCQLQSDETGTCPALWESRQSYAEVVPAPQGQKRGCPQAAGTSQHTDPRIYALLVLCTAVPFGLEFGMKYL